MFHTFRHEDQLVTYFENVCQTQLIAFLLLFRCKRTLAMGFRL